MSRLRLSGVAHAYALKEVLSDIDLTLDAGRVLALVGPNANFPTLSIHAKVVASRRDPEDDHHLLSLQFIDVGKDEMRELEGLVVSMLEGRASG